jgi:hypothetical protein
MDLLVFLLVQEGWESNESIMKTDLKIYVGEVSYLEKGYSSQIQGGAYFGIHRN